MPRRVLQPLGFSMGPSTGAPVGNLGTLPSVSSVLAFPPRTHIFLSWCCPELHTVEQNFLKVSTFICQDRGSQGESRSQIPEATIIWLSLSHAPVSGRELWLGWQSCCKMAAPVSDLHFETGKAVPKHVRYFPWEVLWAGWVWEKHKILHLVLGTFQVVYAKLPQF